MLPNSIWKLADFTINTFHLSYQNNPIKSGRVSAYAGMCMEVSLYTYGETANYKWSPVDLEMKSVQLNKGVWWNTVYWSTSNMLSMPRWNSQGHQNVKL